MLVWNNLVSYCLQIGLLIGVAACIPAVLRLTTPRARLVFWQILLVTCLLLPVLAPKQGRVVSGNVQVIVGSFAMAPSRSAPARVISWNQAALGLLATGAVIRLLWLGMGLWRLRQYRRRSQPLHTNSAWAVEAQLRISEDVASPVMFGFFDPVVLLPANFPEMEPSTQDAILCHEILHVRRKDWLVTLAEEVVRGVFWFHPAIWWLLGEIGLAREQVVDREAIDMTRSRDEYVDALLVIAGAGALPDLAPAPLFLRKRHLKQRVVSILKEVRMSKTRSISALAAGLGMLAAACWLVTMTFPLTAAPQTVTDGAGVTVDTGSSAIMHRSGVMYPVAARRGKVEGTVVVDATIDGTGNVVDARVVSGPTELRSAAMQAVLQWHFANDTGANTRQVSINFKLPAETPGEVGFSTKFGEFRATIAPGGSAAEEAKRLNIPPAPSMAGKTLKRLGIQGLTEEAKQHLSSRLPVHEGDILSDDSFERFVRVVREYDDHLIVNRIPFDKEGNMTFIVVVPGSNMPPSPQSAQPNVPSRIVVGGNVQAASLIFQPKPEYPPNAKQSRIEGTVKLKATIGHEGQIVDLSVIEGPAALMKAAMDAVWQWKYKPTTLNGVPVEVVTQIDVNFTLSQ